MGREQSRCLAQPALGTVACDRIADPLGRRKAKADVSGLDEAVMGARANLQDERVGNPAPASCGNGKKFGATFETDDLIGDRRLLVRDGGASEIAENALIFRRIGAFVLWPFGVRGRGGHRRRPSVLESHDGACGPGCLVGMCVSRDLFLRQTGIKPVRYIECGRYRVKQRAGLNASTAAAFNHDSSLVEPNVSSRGLACRYAM